MEGLADLTLPNESNETLEISLGNPPSEDTQNLDAADSTAAQSSKPDDNAPQPPVVPVSLDSPEPSGPQDAAETNQAVVSRPADVDRLNYFAFNVLADAYHHDVPAEWTCGTILTVANKSRMGNSSYNVQSIPTLEPTEEELIKIPDHNGIHGYLWVGMIPSDKSLDSLAEPAAEDGLADAKDGKSKDPRKKNSKVQAKKHRKSLTIADSTDEEIRIINKDEGALRVVINLMSKTIALNKLINRDATSGTCTLQSVPLENVFFFRPFRNDEAKGSVERRKHFKELFNKLKEAMEKDKHDGVKKALREIRSAPVSPFTPNTATAAKSTAKNSRDCRPKLSNKADPPQTASAEHGKGNQGTKRKKSDIDTSKPPSKARNDGATNSKRQKNSAASNSVSSETRNASDSINPKTSLSGHPNYHTVADPGNDKDGQAFLLPSQAINKDDSPPHKQVYPVNASPVCALPATPKSFLSEPGRDQTATGSSRLSKDSQILPSASTLYAPTPYPAVAMTTTSPTPFRPTNQHARFALMKHPQTTQGTAGREFGFDSTAQETAVKPPATAPFASTAEHDIDAMQAADDVFSISHTLQNRYRGDPTSFLSGQQNYNNQHVEKNIFDSTEQSELDQNSMQRGIEARRAQQLHSRMLLFNQAQLPLGPHGHFSQPSGPVFHPPAPSLQHIQNLQHTQQAQVLRLPTQQQPPQQQQHLQSLISPFDKNNDSFPSNNINHNSRKDALFTDLGQEVISLISCLERCNKSNFNAVKYIKTMIEQISNMPPHVSSIMQLRLGPLPFNVANIEDVQETMFAEFMSLFPDLEQDLDMETFNILLYALQVSEKTVEYSLVRQFIYGFTRELANERSKGGDNPTIRHEAAVQIFEKALKFARDLVYTRNTGKNCGIQEQPPPPSQQQQGMMPIVTTMKTTTTDEIDHVDNSVYHSDLHQRGFTEAGAIDMDFAALEKTFAPPASHIRD